MAIEVNAILDVTSVEKVTKRATTTNIQNNGKVEINEIFVAISAAKPVLINAAAMENPAPKRKMIS